MVERTLDRLIHFDEKSRGYNIRGLLDTTQPRSYTWNVGAWFDQGREGACVGFAWAHELIARPVVRPATEDTARQIYRLAQTVDPWPGQEPDYEGTSVLAGAKILQRWGFMDEYRWAFSTRDALAAISRHGPCVLGVEWREGMFDVDKAGYLHVEGRVVGGHAILATGVNVKNRTVTLHNSWGREWGKDGKGLLSWDDFDTLLRNDGEVCVPVRRS